MRKILRRFSVLPGTMDAEDIPEVTLLGPSDLSNSEFAKCRTIRFETSDGWWEVDAEQVKAALEEAK